VEPQLKLFTDSAADLPHHLKVEYAVGVVPLTVVFGDNEYKDGVTITSEEFYQKLTSETVFPATNQVNPHDFAEAFRPYLDAGSEILYIGLSHRLSGTLQSAVMAKEMLQTDRIHVFDTHSASLGEALYLVRAAEMARSGLSTTEILKNLEQHKESAFGFVMLEDLQHIVRGGRLSKTQGLIGSILQIKPIIQITREGTVEVSDKVRTTKKALQSMIDKALEQQSDYSNDTLAVAHTNAGDLFYEFVDMVKEQLRPKRLIEGLVGPTIGTHAGPGAIGLFY
jgi:DegV family protein with EDD domain